MKLFDPSRRDELTRALWAFRGEFLVVGLFSMVVNVLMLTPTLYMLQVYDRVLVSQSELTLLAVSLITLFLFVMMAVAEWARSRVLVRAGVRFDRHLSTRVFNASFESSLAPTAGSPAPAFNDLLQIRQFLTGQGIFAFFDAPWTPIYIAVAFFLHPLLGWSAVVFAFLQALLAWFGHRRNVKPVEAMTAANNEVSSYLHSKLRNAEVIESMGMVGNLQRRWRGWQNAYLGKSTQAHAVSSQFTAASKFLRYSQQSLSLGIGAILVIRGELSPGAMIAANVLMTRALAPVDQMVDAWRGVISARAAYRRLSSLLNDFPEREPRLSRVPPRGELALRQVVATASGRDQPILKDISFSVPAGAVTAVLGPSGSGKSTLARVMIGIWPAASGEVLLDGLPIDSWNRIELGPHVGYLPQDIELFEGTIAENIARFGPTDSQRVIDAARMTGLHEMILRFPKGYDTPIGEAGRLLSGGQRQRVGLARAVYGEPNLLVLDEPNANLDDAGEQALVKAIQQLKAKGKTVFLVTHRPGVLAAADNLMILQDGVLKLAGPRDKVLAALRNAQRPAAPPPTEPQVSCEQPV